MFVTVPRGAAKQNDCNITDVNQFGYFNKAQALLFFVKPFSVNKVRLHALVYFSKMYLIHELVSISPH